MFVRKSLAKLILLFLAGILFVADFSFAADFSNDGLKVTSSGSTGLSVNFSPVPTYNDTLFSTDGRKIIIPHFKGCYAEYGKTGEPVKIVYSANICVPSPNGFSLNNSSVSEVSMMPELIAPAPEIRVKNNYQYENYVINDAVYNGVKVSEPVELNYSGIARDNYIAVLKFNVAVYNPQTKLVEIRSGFSADIKFDNSLSATTTPKLSGTLPLNLLNQSQASVWQVPAVKHSGSFSKKGTDKIQALSSGKWMKITVDNEGIYVITPNDLSKLGITIPAQDVATIKIFGNGGDNLSERVTDGAGNVMNQQPVIVRTNPDGSLGNIIFYGAPAYGFKYNNGKFHSYYNYYSNSNYYILTFGGDNGKRAVAASQPVSPVVSRPTTYIQRIFQHEEKDCAVISSGKLWLGGSIFPRTITNMLDNLDRNGSILYRIFLAQRADTDGTFTVVENKSVLSQIGLLGAGHDIYNNGYGEEKEVVMPASIISSDNRSYLNISFTNIQPSTATPYFNWLEIHYPRSFVPVSNEISFFTDTTCKNVTEFTINPFTGPEILGFNTTDPANPVLLQNVSSTGGMYIFRDSIADNSPKKYFVSSNFKTPVVTAIEYGNYRDTKYNADMIVITHPALIQSALKYKDYRESQSKIKVEVFRTDLIYNEFGSGIPDVTSIRDFIKYCYDSWDKKPKYLLLWGDGHFDYKNITTQAVNFVPPWESFETLDYYEATSSYTKDDYYACVAGDDNRIDIAEGRVPVQSPQQGDWMVEKIKRYETQMSNDSWRNTLTLMADDGPTTSIYDSDGAQHTNQSEALSKFYIPEDEVQKKVYLVDYANDFITNGRRKPKATADMLSIINTTGTLMLSWVGHGNPRVWAHEEVLNRDVTIPQMTNNNKYFFTTAATCDFGRFDMTDIMSGAEDLFLSQSGASCGVFSAARVVYSGDNAEVTQLFYQQLFTRNPITGYYPTLGEVYFATKQIRTSLNDEKYYILGDPSSTLLIPPYICQIDSINGVYVADRKDTVLLKALSRVNISGRIILPNGSGVDTTFNGTAVITMYDNDVEHDAIDIDTGHSIHHITNFGGALNRSSTEVVNGFFKTSFIIPEDISYQKKPGRVNGYAFTPDNRYAKGSNRCFKLNGLDTTLTGIDETGPIVRIYMDDTTFQAGDVVNKTPLLILKLFDNYGINATGNGIGHRIEAWFDGNPNSIDLTDSYVTSLTDSRYGSVEKYISGLSSGEHKVKVRAWDVFNNFTIAESYFRIAPDGDGIVISSMINVPNPFLTGTVISFEHNIAQPFNADLRIYSVEGRLLRTISGTYSSVHTTEIPWDGLDENGGSISTGTYIFDLSLRTSDGLTAKKQSLGVYTR